MTQVIAHFKIEQKAEMYEKLDAAVGAAQRDAFADGARGVLVTRHDFDHFSIALSTEVPFGLVYEDDQVLRN